MSIERTIEKLLYMSKDERHRVLRSAWNKYTKLISDIAHDIYSSCIQDYYSQYNPTVYKRHGFPEGKNLYQADAIEWTESEMRIRFAASQLWKYAGKKDKRSKVLKSVMEGKRGAKSRKTPDGWPMSWYTSYPNEFSTEFEWNGLSGDLTMQEIMDYFVENVIEETEDVFWEYLDELM